MSDIRSEEQEQLEAIKHWFQQNALAILGAIIIGAGIFFGPDLYQSYKNSKIWPVSDLYSEFAAEVSRVSGSPQPDDQDLEEVSYLADNLIESYPDTHYAFLASLSVAGLNAKLGEYESARERLQWAAERAQEEADVQLVNYRLALVEAQLGETQSALDRLSGANTYFAPIYSAARGDIHASLGQREQAISAYEDALAQLPAGNLSQSNTIQLKLDNLQSGAGALMQE